MLRFFANVMPVFQLTMGGLNRSEWVDMLRFRHFFLLSSFVIIPHYSRLAFATPLLCNRRQSEVLSNIYRTSIEHLSKTYRSDHTAILFYTPTLFVCCTLFPKLHGLHIRTRRDGEEINSRREGRERDTLRRASSNIVETNRRETCAVSRTERDRDIRSISKER